jgi:hypothetical protein
MDPLTGDTASASVRSTISASTTFTFSNVDMPLWEPPVFRVCTPRLHPPDPRSQKRDLPAGFGTQIPCRPDCSQRRGSLTRPIGTSASMCLIRAPITSTTTRSASTAQPKGAELI